MEYDMIYVNPYPLDSISYKIYENNKVDPYELINNASDVDKYIIYLYVMGETLVRISKIAKCNIKTVSNKLNKYGVKING